jgi:hypothetical protein
MSDVSMDSAKSGADDDEGGSAEHDAEGGSAEASAPAAGGLAALKKPPPGNAMNLFKSAL